ncbi:TIGR02281 family clan AA aspartic protease [Sphingomonas sp. KR1UV-12]|uniref:TIGR02281 family clan AA aspartic protease n=1 Tax=Sphingomonas aurea TaxID=3063994 RepID=A0ABT9EMY6_9SPHN|nr:TIGR02281 family clan AA aspartic protease [Sphingomonas sp. KR1UV-12]MDP1028013.1 TIGR02281 family clan AA aspartic protease [Sphingomonas sp. KR1UV-12]
MFPLSGSAPVPYILAAALVVVILVARRVPVIGGLVRLATWGALALLLVTVLGERAMVDPYLARIATFLKLDDQRVVGDTMRIRMSSDGHFWVRVKLGGTERRMLIDSGATVTAISTGTAAAAGLTPSDGIVPVVLRTANGSVQAQTATVPELRLGNIVARDLSVVVSPAFGDMDVIGMNFLSRLKSWRVEDNTLILEPHHPQATAG